MKNQKPKVATDEESNLEAESNLRPPLRWLLRNFWLKFRIPFIVALIISGWIYIPKLEAQKEQNALAQAFFAVCRRTLKDTAQLPKIPDEALQQALKTRPITESAYRQWSPQVYCEIRKKEWVAHITFTSPSPYSVEETIGPVLAEAGYDTPSPGP